MVAVFGGARFHAGQASAAHALFARHGNVKTRGQQGLQGGLGGRQSFGLAVWPHLRKPESPEPGCTNIGRFHTQPFASMPRVVDFGDPDKIEALLAGGVSERYFQPHQNDQARLWAAGQRTAWWFNPVQVEENAVARAVLVP